MESYGMDARTAVLFNNVKHVPFRSTFGAGEEHRVARKDLNGKIAEFKWSGDQGWLFYRHRPDKQSANSFLAAEQTFVYLQSPITP